MVTAKTATTVHEHGRMHVPRTRGMVSGLVLLVLGVWGGLIPFIGPLFGYAYTPDTAWTWTTGRLWLEILPAIAAIAGGLLLIGSANRATALFGGWLGALAGAWFIVGQPLSQLWNEGLPAAGEPAAAGALGRTMEQIGFFSGLGAVMLFFAAVALGRLTVIGVRDVRPRAVVEDDAAHRRGADGDGGFGEVGSAGEPGGRAVGDRPDPAPGATRRG